MMRITLTETAIPGCFALQLPRHEDLRGAFVKSFQEDALADLGLENRFVETFATTSSEQVLRGMHLQLPPADHVKLVYCLAGHAQDVLLDLRKGSPTFGRHVTIELAADQARAVYLARGIAHGFCVRQAPVVMMYHVTSYHVPSLDAGVAWDSFGADWAVSRPRISARDAALPRLADFDSPFQYSSDGTRAK